MRIIGLTGRESGCGYHRIILPLGFMDGIKGYVTNMITEDKTDDWDILLYNRICPYDKDWDELKKIIGCKIVLDLDDYWKLPPNHLNYFQYEEFAKRIENNIRQADLVTVTNERLAERVRTFNDNVHIAPNGIPFGKNQFIEDRRESDQIRIFWAGGVTHEMDIRMLKNPISKLRMYRDRIKMVMGGYCDLDAYTKSIWDRMFSYFTCAGELPYMKLHSTLPINYMQMYEHADIMVIPLEDSEWHGCKSNLKMLEAASRRIPVIVSNVEPYSRDQDAPVLWVNTQKDWFNHLNYLINNPAAREEYGNNLYEWAKQKYSIEKINEGRFSAFSSICEAPALL